MDSKETSFTLKQLVNVLAKSSPFSVTTVSEHRKHDAFDDIKRYLYIEQDIEKEFRKRLTQLKQGDILFLCGSSGDGKSEILKRCHDEYKNEFYFHLDATHSFAPDQSAIQALDQVFDTITESLQPLILGINVGMLANYAKEGAERHHHIKVLIDHFLEQGQQENNKCQFLDFEQYPKFYVAENQTNYSRFAKQLMQRLTAPNSSNPFYIAAKNDEEAKKDLRLVANFRLLARESVQDVIITNLFKARLKKDQFITTRALLDLIHHLLLGEGYLSDNLFYATDNELVQRLSDFDPLLNHTKALDQFVLRYELELPDPELADFLSVLEKEHIVFKKGKSASLIRFFYLMRHESIGNNYHQLFASDFNEELLEKYSRIWFLHKNYDGSDLLKNELRQFYMNEFIRSVFNYANRNAPFLRQGDLFLGEFGSIQVAAPLSLKPDYSEIQKKKLPKSAYFDAYLKFDNQSLIPISINLNLFELIYKLNRGYRPNKYDKNAIVLLDAIIEQMTEFAQSMSILRFYECRDCYEVHKDDGLFIVSKGVV